MDSNTILIISAFVVFVILLFGIAAIMLKDVSLKLIFQARIAKLRYKAGMFFLICAKRLLQPTMPRAQVDYEVLDIGRNAQRSNSFATGARNRGFHYD